ncbi:DIP1984 family protein [Vagococcus xieshaowenii]|uniref:Uncharacterized protein n=1 Tax=Vagococcus xieshaowenii TaxID=2562451 RepID=A0AAJ5JKV9_9ENTE|nr:DIP1984 family protein [Vagococcus xieshaowenii]QCA29351.1 hypothetical protein E4Z98_08480 [Vagococcus xieshaowenii]TFZ39357.1 hypothetical protein E4031_09445 [Vagococcus xieshaowenii]
MKLAEALIEKKALEDKQYELIERFRQSVKIQEGETSYEDCEAILNELEMCYQQSNHLLKKITRTNQMVTIEGKTLVECLIDRKTIATQRDSMQKLYHYMTEKDYRISRAEIKTVLMMNPVEVNKKINQLSKELRLLDTKIQEKNWTVDLIE